MMNSIKCAMVALNIHQHMHDNVSSCSYHATENPVFWQKKFTATLSQLSDHLLHTKQTRLHLCIIMYNYWIMFVK